MSNIGWVGLGNMGSHMAANLVQAGHSVKGFDLNPAALNQAVEAGVTAAKSVADTVQDVDVVFTMLPKGEHVRSVFDGPEGIWANASQNTLLVDSSTVDIDTARFLHDKSQELDFDFVDAPVSGGISGAAAGTLAFMLGGSPSNTSRAESYIEPMARKIFVAGGPTMGIAAKIANNMMLFINVLANSEGSQLAEQLGLDPKIFWEIVTASSGQSWAQQTWYPMPGIIEASPANRNFDPGFATALARKDVGLALDAGASAGISLPAATLAREQFDRLIEEGMATKDCTLIAKYVNPAGDVRGWENVGGNVSDEDAA